MQRIRKIILRQFEQYTHRHRDAAFIGDWTRTTLLNAVVSGDLDCMKYALKNGCPLNSNYAEQLEDSICGMSSEVEEICAAASSNGHLECLKYLHENGCPWNETTTLNAVSYGHLECLRYAIQNGCPYDTEKVEIALFEMYAEKK
ncbi:uncharacterized protein LOC126844442 isoform X2 [Adelges cooleyi]|uniref:uncharacterized protein LOC126844442 isoform X2 n=1 Tax=Adelges cooleyi TaxID=133065 RepID=UPI002180501A|nr:uncharacterized protein LOC126844442 isoform X2 [Adelges cooleyi]